MFRLLHIEKPFLAVVSGLLPLPWWWVVPGLLGLLGGASTGLALAPALRVLTWPLLALTLVMLGRGWYLQQSHRGGWRSSWGQRAGLVLLGSTVLAAVLWSLRFTGLLGMSPL